MAKHHTKATLECTKHCAKCKRTTRHRVDGGREGSCLECYAKPAPPRPLVAVEVPIACACDAYSFPHLHDRQIREANQAWERWARQTGITDARREA